MSQSLSLKGIDDNKKRTLRAKSTRDRFYLFTNITPSSKLRDEEDVVHDFFGRGYVLHGGAGPLKVNRQVLVVFGILLLREVGLYQTEVVPQAHLDCC